MDAESIQKSLISQLQMLVMMKLTTHIYLNKVFYLAKSLGVTQKVQDGIKKKTHKMSQKDFWSNFDHFLILE